jgi:opacity protein-like surface antigen
MKLRIVLAVCAAVTASAAMAQTPTAKSGPNNNAINRAGQNNSNAPVAGRNSFTEGQAKSRIEGAGYTNVSALEKDANGVWRGKGSKGGTTSNVSVDFEGNVNSAK